MTKPKDPAVPSILLLGTGHWSNPGLDYRSTDYDDMLAPERQRQLADCLDRLTHFAPTKVALEVMCSRQDELDADFSRYRNGEFSLTSNERHQLGFRLAAMMGHDRIYGIDWHNLERAIGWDEAIDHALRNGQEHLVTAFSEPGSEERVRQAAAESARIRSLGVREQLVEMNEWEAADAGHRAYADMALIGEGTNYVGADVILRWYERNMKIFVNIARLVETPDDRILVVIGGGHLPLLRHFLELSGRFRLVSPVPLLKDEVGGA